MSPDSSFWKHAVASCVALAMLVPGAFSVGQDVTDSLGTRFRLLPGGRYVRGTSGGERTLQRAFPLSTTGQGYGNAESPEHVTWITRPFFLAETEVTRGQFRRFVEATGYQTTAETARAEMVGWAPTPDDAPLYQSFDFRRDSEFNWKNPGFVQGDDHPVVGVSFADAIAYCRWLSETDGVEYRLPTEAEWEYACRAGTTSWFSFGDQAQGVIHRHGNVGNVELEKHRKHAAERQWLLDWENAPGDGFIFTAPVASFQANAFGLHDLHGNVWEWCSDLWLDTVYKEFERPRYDQPTGTAVDPHNADRPQTATNDFRTIRGGSWYNGDLHCRSANRSYWDAEDAACYLGFRLARDADPDASNESIKAYRLEQQALDTIKQAGGTILSSQGIDLEVRLDGNSRSAEVLDALGLLPDLRRLRLGWDRDDSSLGQAELEQIVNLTDLEELEFRRGVSLVGLDLSVLPRLKQLRSLSFPRDAPLDNHQLHALAGFRSLRVFRCYGAAGGTTDDGIRALAGNRQLETLHVWENEANGSFLQAFLNRPIKDLASTARYGQPGRMRDPEGAVLSRFPELQRLTLDGQQNLGPDTALAISHLPGLTELHLSRCTGLSDGDLAMVGKLAKLQHLNLSETGAGDLTSKAIGAIPRIVSLRIGTETDRGFLSDEGVRALAEAFSLEEIELAGDAITDQGLRTLGRVNRLKRLTVTSRAIRGPGLRTLADLPELQDLALRTPSLTDVAFEHLSAAKSLRKIRLAIRGYQPPMALTDQGIKRMETATWLKELWLPRNDTEITEEQINRLNERMPKTSVIAYTVDWEQ